MRNVAQGQRLQTVSDTLQFTSSALREWVHCFAHQSTQGLVDRPHPVQPPKITCELEKHRNRLGGQDPLQHGSLYSQWRYREHTTVLAQQTDIQRGRESVCCVLKNALSYCRPTGRLDPTPAEITYGSLQRAALG